jgi:hypothetical protein
MHQELIQVKALASSPRHCAPVLKPDQQAVSNPRGNKVRLVVGLLTTGEQLASALAELGDRHLSPDRIRIIAQPGALGSALSRSPANDEPAPAGHAWIICRPGQARGSVVPGASPDDFELLGHIRAIIEEHRWPLLRQAQQLDRHLSVGGALIVVEADSDDQEWEACTALLRHASGGIQTHEIADTQR